MEQLKIQLIKLVMELGVFFSKCDDDFDEREAKFLDDYVDKMVASDQAQKKELEEIKKEVNMMPNIEDLIHETKQMINAVEEHEKVPLLKTLSYFIHGIIMADGMIHPNETKFYTEWKNAFGLDDNISIDEYLK